MVVSFTIEYNTMGIGMLASSSRRMEVSMSTLKQDPFLPKAMPVRKEVRRTVPPSTREISPSSLPTWAGQVGIRQNLCSGELSTDCAPRTFSNRQKY